MAFAQQPVESTSNESDPMLRIGKSYLGTRYVANTLDRNEVEQLVINTKEVDCLTFVEYTLAQALGSSFADNLQKVISVAAMFSMMGGKNAKLMAEYQGSGHTCRISRFS